MNAMQIIGYEWDESEGGKKTMLVHYQLGAGIKTIPLKKLGTVIEACLQEGNPSQAEFDFSGRENGK